MNEEIKTAAELFKEVESLCGVVRLAANQAFACTGGIPEGELRDEAIKTLQETLLTVINLYKGEPDGDD